MLERIRSFLAQPLLEAKGSDLKWIGNYEVRQVLGEGGTALVLRGEGEGRVVAIKVAHIAGTTLPEASVLRRLRHERIPRFMDAGVLPDGRAYLVRQYVEGVALDQFAFRDLASYCRCMQELLEALEYAHSKNILHRDLKPANVLVGADGRPWLIDFGAAGAVVREPGLEPTRNAPLTPRYASPEQLRGEAARVESDIYAFGGLLAEGLKQFPASAWKRRLEEVAARCLAHDASKRYRSAKSVREALRSASPGRAFRRSSIGAATAMVIGLIGLGIWQEKELADFERQRDALEPMMLSQWQVADSSKDIQTSIAALRSSLQLLGELDEMRPGDKKVLQMQAQGTLMLAHLEGHPAFLNAGNPEVSRKHLQDALEISLRYKKVADEPCLAWGMVGEISASLSSQSVDAGQLAKAGSALVWLARAREAMRQLPECRESGERIQVYQMAQASRLAFARQDWEECLRLRREVLARRQQFWRGQAGIEGLRVRMDLIEARTSLGYALAASGQLAEAAEHYEVALTGFEKLREDYPSSLLLAKRLARSQRQLAGIQSRLGRQAAAAQLAQRAEGIERMLGTQ